MNADVVVDIGEASASLKKGQTLAIKIDNPGSTGIKATDVVFVLPDGMKSMGVQSFAPNPDTKIGGTFRCLFVKVDKSGDIEANWAIGQSYGEEGEPQRNFITVTVS